MMPVKLGQARPTQSWHEPYAFLMTLLFGLMVVLYAQSNATRGGAPKAQAPGAESAKSDEEPAPESSGKTSAIATHRAQAPAPSATQAPVAVTPAQKQTTDAIEKIALGTGAQASGRAATDPAPRVGWEWQGPRRLRIRIERGAAGIFASGSAKLTPELEALVFKLGEVLSRRRRELEATDHKIRVEVVASNLKLASERATTLASIWIQSRIFEPSEVAVELGLSKSTESSEDVSWVLLL